MASQVLGGATRAVVATSVMTMPAPASSHLDCASKDSRPERVSDSGGSWVLRFRR